MLVPKSEVASGGSPVLLTYVPRDGLFDSTSAQMLATVLHGFTQSLYENVGLVQWFSNFLPLSPPPLGKRKYSQTPPPSRFFLPK
jgi:hypothetical protein